MAASGNRPDLRIIAGVAFLIGAGVLAFVKPAIAVMVLVAGGVLMATGVAATRKAALPGVAPGPPPSADGGGGPA